MRTGELARCLLAIALVVTITLDALAQVHRNWGPLNAHAPQSRLWKSPARFKVIAAGRRSGKTLLVKRALIARAMSFTAYPDGWFVFAAPTRPQVKRLYWSDLKGMIPRQLITNIDATDLTVTLWNGCQITCLGMDEPKRLHGKDLDGIGLDEMADMKAGIWDEDVNPALATPGRPGVAWIYGVPRMGKAGSSSFRELYQKGLDETIPDFESFTWPSSDIMDEAEIASLRRTMDSLTFEQEINATWTNFQGRAYYDFARETHCATLEYQRHRDLIFCLDFNKAPGTAAVLQDQPRPEGRDDCHDFVSACIGEVWIPKNSDSIKVARRLAKDWGPEGRNHLGRVLLYGDATGGIGGSAAVEGNDWELVVKTLRPVFGNRLFEMFGRSNPPERSRVNTMNARIKTTEGTIGFLVDPQKAPHVVRDFEEVVLVEGGSGELLKEKGGDLTHISDGVGYHVFEEHPIEDRVAAA